MLFSRFYFYYAICIVLENKPGMNKMAQINIKRKIYPQIKKNKFKKKKRWREKLKNKLTKSSEKNRSLQNRHMHVEEDINTVQKQESVQKRYLSQQKDNNPNENPQLPWTRLYIIILLINWGIICNSQHFILAFLKYK